MPTRATSWRPSAWARNCSSCSALLNPHVPAVYRAGDAAGYFFIEMEYIDGHDLAELIASGLPPERAARIAREVAQFLEKAHGFNARVDGREFGALVHADLKPKNIRLNATGTVKVLDFGISKGLSLTGRLTTAAFGSRLYMSPEWLDTGRLDRHVDLWALGVVLYEMLAGHLPFRTESARQLELLLREGAPPLPLPATCPASLQRIVLKALAPSLPARYQTATAVKNDLDAWLDGRATVADVEWARDLEAQATRRTSLPAPDRPVSDETRRTATPAPADDEATRRTLPPATAGAPPTTPSEVAESPATSPPRRRVRTWARRFAVFVIMAVVVNEYAACRAASALRAELPTRETTTLDAAWTEYEAVRDSSVLGLARQRVDGPMRDALATHADRVIADFKFDRPTVRERQWQQASAWLGNALRIDPGDSTLLARLRYCEGQLRRIDGEARLRGGKRPDAERLLHEAVLRFEEAARLDRTWPDPWLGLLRTYVHGLDDPSRAVEALNEAERRGYRAGRREFLLLGEAHFARAERAQRECERLPVEQQCGCLERAGGLYRQSGSWLERAPADAETSRGLLRATERRLATSTRMFERGCTDTSIDD